MLILPFLRQGDKVLIGDDIVITIACVERRGRVRLGVQAPEHVQIARSEIHQRWKNKPRGD